MKWWFIQLFKLQVFSLSVVVSGQEDEDNEIDDEEMGIYVSGGSPSRKRMAGTDESDDSR